MCFGSSGGPRGSWAGGRSGHLPLGAWGLPVVGLGAGVPGLLGVAAVGLLGVVAMAVVPVATGLRGTMPVPCPSTCRVGDALGEPPPDRAIVLDEHTKPAGAVKRFVWWMCWFSLGSGPVCSGCGGRSSP